MMVMNKATVSAMSLLVLPLSSLMVMGRSSLILSRAAVQSNLQHDQVNQESTLSYGCNAYLYLAMKLSTVGNSSL